MPFSRNNLVLCDFHDFKGDSCTFCSIKSLFERYKISLKMQILNVTEHNSRDFSKLDPSTVAKLVISKTESLTVMYEKCL